MEQHDLGTMASDVLSMVSQGQLDPLITGVLPFSDLVEGLRSLAEHKVTGKLVGTMASDVLSMVSQGQLDPLITGVLPFSDLVEGLRSLAEHKVTGKLVVDFDA